MNLKKNAFLIILSIIFINSSSILLSQEGELIFGIKAGANMSTLNGEGSNLSYGQYLIDPTSKLGGVFGTFITYMFSPEFAIQPEFLYTMKGVNYDADEYKQIWTFSYIEAPVLFKTIFSMKDNVIGAFYAGPSIAYLVKKDFKLTINNYDQKIGNLEGQNNMDFSAVVGVGGDMKAFKGRLGIDVRYTYGLTSIQNNISRQNGTISLSLYYAFDDGVHFED